MRESQELLKDGAEVQGLERFGERALPPPPVIGYIESEDDEELPLRSYWRSVRKHWLQIIGLTLPVTLLAAIYVARRPDIYEARARVQVDSENIPGIGNSSNSSVVVNTDSPAYFSTQLQILESPALLRRVVKTLGLDHDQYFLSPRGNSTSQNLLRMLGVKSGKGDDANRRGEERMPSEDEIAPADNQEDLAEAKRLAGSVGLLSGGLTVSPVVDNRLKTETRLIDITYAHSDPQVATRIVNTIAIIYVRSNLERKSQASAIAGTFLQKRIAELQTAIREGEERLAEYSKKHQILSLEPAQNTVVNRLNGINNELLAAENDRKLAEAEYHASLAPDFVDASMETATAATTARINDLRQKRAELLVEDTEEMPEVKQINEQIAELEKQIKSSRERAKATLIATLTKRYRQALDREQKLQAAFNQQRSETLVQNEAAVNYHILQQEIDTNKGLLNAMLQKSKENDVAIAGLVGTPNNVYVRDYALVPGSPVGPKRWQNVGVAFLLSLAFGVGLALFRDYLDDTIHSIGEVERVLHLPALADIPLVGGSARRHLLPAAAALQLRNGNGNSHYPLILNEDEQSVLAEAYRHLRTSVLMSTAGRTPKTILVASSLPAEGKTTTAVNMALVLAQTGASVLIIDGDMRHPCLHSIFGLENERGLSTILSSQKSEVEMLSFIEQDKRSGLYVLPSGPVPPNPAELLSSEQMRRLFAFVESTFTHIIIDSPPVAYFTDSVLVSPAVDGVLLVVQNGKSSRQIVQRSRKLLQDVGARIFGVVLNGGKEGSSGNYYYSPYYS